MRKKYIGTRLPQMTEAKSGGEQPDNGDSGRRELVALNHGISACFGMG